MTELTPFDELMSQVMVHTDHFGHRQHVQLTWLAVQRYGTAAAVELISNGIQRTATYAGRPQKYHVTISRAWVELVGHHLAFSNATDFDTFAKQNPALLDKRLLTRFYRSSTLAGSQARTSWVEPDLVPFPWQAGEYSHPVNYGGDFTEYWLRIGAAEHRRDPLGELAAFAGQQLR